MVDIAALPIGALLCVKNSVSDGFAVFLGETVVVCDHRCCRSRPEPRPHLWFLTSDGVFPKHCVIGLPQGVGGRNLLERDSKVIA